MTPASDRHGQGNERVALVSGTASGIGAAVASRLRDCGWLAVGLDRQAAGPDAIVVDVADSAEVQETVRRVEADVGPVDALVSAAGHYGRSPLAQITPEDWERMLRVHLGGLFNMARAVLPGMLARRSGSVVAVTSELALAGGDQEAHYSAAKGAVIGLVRSLATEAAPQGVRVNAVAPGPTDTPMLSADSPWRAPDYLDTLPARRLASPAEIAQAVSFLIDKPGFCNGEVLSPNCGAVT